MKRNIALMLILALLLGIFCGCKSADEEDFSALTDGEISFEQEEQEEKDSSSDPEKEQEKEPNQESEQEPSPDPLRKWQPPSCMRWFTTTTMFMVFRTVPEATPTTTASLEMQPWLMV